MNTDRDSHTSTSDGWNSGTISPDQQFSFTFQAADTFPITAPFIQGWWAGSSCVDSIVWPKAQKGRETSVQADSATPSPRLDSQPPGTAHVVLEQFERHGVANGKIIERRALAHVAAVEKDFTIVRQPDEPMALADEQRDNSSRAWRAAAFRW
jgi:hypothetical protein